MYVPLRRSCVHTRRDAPRPPAARYVHVARDELAVGEEEEEEEEEEAVGRGRGGPVVDWTAEFSCSVCCHLNLMRPTRKSLELLAFSRAEEDPTIEASRKKAKTCPEDDTKDSGRAMPAVQHYAELQAEVDTCRSRTFLTGTIALLAIIL